MFLNGFSNSFYKTLQGLLPDVSVTSFPITFFFSKPGLSEHSFMIPFYLLSGFLRIYAQKSLHQRQQACLTLSYLGFLHNMHPLLKCNMCAYCCFHAQIQAGADEQIK
jgi:hypothetical protein